MALIELPRRDGDSLWVEVDDVDLPLVSAYRWFAHQGGRRAGWYAVANARWPDGRKRTLRMHALLMGQDGVDHIDRNGLNNRRSNLRPATASQNQANRPVMQGCTSRHRGVSWNKAKAKWRAYIKIDGVQRHLGMFEEEDDAALAFDIAARAAWGDFIEPNIVRR